MSEETGRFSLTATGCPAAAQLRSASSSISVNLVASPWRIPKSSCPVSFLRACGAVQGSPAVRPRALPASHMRHTCRRERGPPQRPAPPSSIRWLRRICRSPRPAPGRVLHTPCRRNDGGWVHRCDEAHSARSIADNYLPHEPRGFKLFEHPIDGCSSDRARSIPQREFELDHRDCTCLSVQAVDDRLASSAGSAAALGKPAPRPGAPTLGSGIRAHPGSESCRGLARAFARPSRPTGGSDGGGPAWSATPAGIRSGPHDRAGPRPAVARYAST